MIRRKLKDFFMQRHENGHILEMLDSEELSLIDRFLAPGDVGHKEYLAAELMERTLNNIDPAFPFFASLFDTESQKLSAMEKGVIYMNDSYRGHYIHSVYTYLMGFFLFQDKLLGKEFLKCLHLSYFDTHYKHRPYYNMIGVQSKDEKKEFQKRWALAVFFHDLAYPSQVSLENLQAEGERLINIKRPYSLSINDLQSFLINPRMSKVKEKVKMGFAPEYLYEEDMLEILAHRMVNRLQSFSKDLIYQSLREFILNGLKRGFFDHGLLGALFLLQQFYSQLYSFYVENKDQKKEKEDTINRFARDKLSINRNILRFTDAMAAVALHNIKIFETGIFRKELDLKIVSNRLPLAFLLILSDELQSWAREMEPPREMIQLSNIRGINKRKLDKTMFLEHFNHLYQAYASPQVDDKSIAFIIPFWEAGKDENKPGGNKKETGKNENNTKALEDKTGENKNKTGENENKSKSFSYHILMKETENEIFTFEFKVERLYFLSKILIEHAPGAIERKRALELEKASWERFKKDNLTFGQFMDLVFAFKEFLDINKIDEKEQSQNLPKGDNSIKVKALDCLIEKILPALKLLKKGQDNLFSYLKPHHFHDIQLPEDPCTSSEECKLLLRYPGKDVQDIEKIIKDRLGQEPDHMQQKKPVVNYTLNSLTNLNRIINERYVPKIEEYMYGIQEDKFEIIKLKELTEKTNDQR